MSIELKNVSYVYGKEEALQVRALEDVSFVIPDGQFVGIIGHTGSGKSTLIQQLNGLIRPTSGEVLYNGKDIWEEGYPLRELRFRVGLVFQYPEYQLFEATVLEDVCFGPKNQGLSEDGARERAEAALGLTGIPEELFHRAPFELSGGQKRRIAIAGVLAMDPDVLVLDEPTAGLDPGGRDDMFSLMEKIRKERGTTIVLVSHSMEDVARHADRLIVMNKGHVQFDGTPREVFAHYRELEEIGLAAPQVTYIMNELKELGFDVDTRAITVEEARDSILAALGKTSGNR